MNVLLHSYPHMIGFYTDDRWGVSIALIWSSLLFLLNKEHGFFAVCVTPVCLPALGC